MGRRSGCHWLRGYRARAVACWQYVCRISSDVPRHGVCDTIRALATQLLAEQQSAEPKRSAENGGQPCRDFGAIMANVRNLLGLYAIVVILELPNASVLGSVLPRTPDAANGRSCCPI